MDASTTRKQIFASITDQKTNKSVLANGRAKTENLYNVNYVDEKGPYVEISSAMLMEGWKIGIYKLQLQYSISSQNSEWSSICYLKATSPSSQININILNAAEGDVIYNNSPVFKGKYINTEDMQETEARYRFDLCNTYGEIIETTGWKAHSSSSDIDDCVFNTELQDLETYQVNYAIETKNGYIGQTQYVFTCFVSILDNPGLYFQSTKNNMEEGCIDLEIVCDQSLVENLILRRTDSNSNFNKWEDYKYFQVLDTNYPSEDPLLFSDFLVESGVEYKYSISVITQENQRGAATYSDSILCEYQHMFLVGDNKQLKIKYNPKISNLKRQLQETKTETIGAKYPFIRRNGEVNYFTFPISGLISYKSDEQNLFYTFDYESKDRYGKVIKFHDAFDTYVNLDNVNITYERMFRKQVEEFLTNGNYKFFKSPTEGIHIISLMNTSLSPNDTLGRMLYSFSSTANEVADANLTNALNYGIWLKGNYIAPKNMGLKYVNGSINNVKTSNVDQNLFQKIADKENSEQTGYSSQIKYLNFLQIEVSSNNTAQIPKCTIVLTQKDGTETEIVVNGNFVLDEVIDIYGLTLKGQTEKMAVSIFYKGYCEYNINNRSKNYMDYTGITKFYSLHKTFSIAEGNNGDVFQAIIEEEQKQNVIIDQILGLSFLRIDIESPSGGKAEFYINDILKPISDDSFELQDKVTSLRCNLGGSVTSITATITVIYHARVYVS